MIQVTSKDAWRIAMVSRLNSAPKLITWMIGWLLGHWMLLVRLNWDAIQCHWYWVLLLLREFHSSNHRWCSVQYECRERRSLKWDWCIWKHGMCEPVSERLSDAKMVFQWHIYLPIWQDQTKIRPHQRFCCFDHLDRLIIRIKVHLTRELLPISLC